MYQMFYCCSLLHFSNLIDLWTISDSSASYFWLGCFIIILQFFFFKNKHGTLSLFQIYIYNISFHCVACIFTFIVILSASSLWTEFTGIPLLIKGHKDSHLYFLQNCLLYSYLHDFLYYMEIFIIYSTINVLIALFT